jgi:hypothetical protein
VSSEGHARVGRAPAVPDDDVRASAIADGSEREPILSRNARCWSAAGVSQALR